LATFPPARVLFYTHVDVLKRFVQQLSDLQQCWCRFVKETIEGSHLDPLLICALRYSLAALLVLPALLGPGLSKVNWSLSLELGFALFCGYQSQTRQLMTETASQGSIMLAVFILLVPVVEHAFGRPFTRKKVVSLAVALSGISLLGFGSAFLLFFRHRSDILSQALAVTHIKHDRSLALANVYWFMNGYIQPHFGLFTFVEVCGLPQM
jgi:hypothetical protein